MIFTASHRYISAIFLLAPFGILTSRIYDEEGHARSQSYYYALIAGIIYAIISTFLLLNVIGASNLSVSVSGKAEFQVLRQRYNPSFKILSIAQRGIMLQTISFVLYLALMAGVYSAVEGWSFVDAVYWADYTLLTIGLGMVARSLTGPPVLTLVQVAILRQRQPLVAFYSSRFLFLASFSLVWLSIAFEAS
jgi:potassium channel subfamily K, other eukaryote